MITPVDIGPISLATYRPDMGKRYRADITIHVVAISLLLLVAKTNNFLSSSRAFYPSFSNAELPFVLVFMVFCE